MDGKSLSSLEILLVERNPGDLNLFFEAFKELSFPYEIRFTGSGEEALRIIQQMNPYEDVPKPDVVIFDVQSFNTDEWGILNQVAKGSDIKCFPVIIMTDGMKGEMKNSYNRKCSYLFIERPNQLKEYKNIINSVRKFWQEKIQRNESTII